MTGLIPTVTFYRDRTTGELVRKAGQHQEDMCMDVMLAVVNLRNRRTVLVAATDADEVLATLAEWEVQP